MELIIMKFQFLAGLTLKILVHAEWERHDGQLNNYLEVPNNSKITDDVFTKWLYKSDNTMSWGTNSFLVISIAHSYTPTSLIIRVLTPNLSRATLQILEGETRDNKRKKD